jgi:hypothetical protein
MTRWQQGLLVGYALGAFSGWWACRWKLEYDCWRARRRMARQSPLPPTSANTELSGQE